MEKTSLFSIVIPVYNVKPYLKQCLDSILAQDEQSWEAIVVDDGSTDGSSDICDEYASKDSRFRVFHKENGGVSSARNLGLDKAQGEWIWFVDADDWIKDGALSILYKEISDECDTIFHGYKVIRVGNFVEEICVGEESTDRIHILRDFRFFQNGMIIFSNRIIQKYNIRYTLGMKMAEDFEFQYKYLLHCKSPVAIQYSLYYFRDRSGSASHNNNTQFNNLEGNKIILNNILGYVKSLPDKGIEWLGPRMAERVKSLMQSAALTQTADRTEVQKIARKYIKEYQELGYKGFDGLSFKLARIDVRIYFFAYKALLKFKEIKDKSY